jgi:hypothetical protein
MDHAPPERRDPLERLSEIAHGEVGQRKGIAWSTPAGVDAERWGSCVRLPALSLGILAGLERNAEKLRPEVPGALGIICGELDKGQRGASHCPHNKGVADPLA